jgi:curli biogenesis system outer membrane secretion channel CsgG
MGKRALGRPKKVCVPFVAALAAAGVLAACATGAVVTRGGGESLEAAQADPALGGKYRIMVASIIDKTDKLKEDSIDRQLEAVNERNPGAARLTRDGILHGIQDMLVTELFQQGRFIVLERAALNDVIAEQEFANSASAGDATRIPKAQLEGADLIVLGAVTAFDAGAGGGALPIPIPLGDRGDFGVLKLRYKRGYVAMDLRVVDARTGRVLSSVAVSGRNGRFGMDFGVHLWSSHSRIDLPGVLTYFQNTPVEKALQEMVTAAVRHVSERVPLH